MAAARSMVPCSEDAARYRDDVGPRPAEKRHHPPLPLRARRQPHLRRPGRPLRRGRHPGEAEETARQGCGRELCAHRTAVDTRASARPTFFELGPLNAAIRVLLDELNDRPMKKLDVSRRVLYEQLDRPALRPLSARPMVTPTVRGRRPRADRTSTPPGAPEVVSQRRHRPRVRPRRRHAPADAARRPPRPPSTRRPAAVVHVEREQTAAAAHHAPATFRHQPSEQAIAVPGPLPPCRSARRDRSQPTMPRIGTATFIHTFRLTTPASPHRACRAAVRVRFGDLPSRPTSCMTPRSWTGAMPGMRRRARRFTSFARTDTAVPRKQGGGRCSNADGSGSAPYVHPTRADATEDKVGVRP